MSFDVVSLFMKVPVDLAVKVAHERLSMDTSMIERTSPSADQVVKLLQFCLDATFLSYRGDFYQQTFGTAMGSPVSVTVANLVAGDDLEDPGPTQDSHLFPATPYPEADIGQVEGPNTFTTTRWCHVPNPVWHLLKVVHWPDR